VSSLLLLGYLLIIQEKRRKVKTEKEKKKKSENLFQKRDLFTKKVFTKSGFCSKIKRKII